MSSSFLEIIEMPNGDIVLQRAEDDREIGGEPLVTIQFSEESKDYLMDNALEVARAMIQSGIQTAAQMAEDGQIEISGGFDTETGADGDAEMAEEQADDITTDGSPRVLH